MERKRWDYNKCFTKYGKSTEQ